MRRGLPAAGRDLLFVLADPGQDVNQHSQKLFEAVVNNVPDTRVRFAQRCAKIAARMRRIGMRNIQCQNEERNYIR